jgi:hypothetical protein
MKTYVYTLFITSNYLPTKIEPVAPKPVKVHYRLKGFVTLVTYCYNNVFVVVKFNSPWCNRPLVKLNSL